MTESADKQVFSAIGRRKTSTARVSIFRGGKGFMINGHRHARYLQRLNLQMIVEQPLKETNLLEQFRVRANVRGGGIAGQANAIRLGISRALLKYDENLKPTLRRSGLLTRDPREKERKKPGRKGARRSFQFTKR